MPIALIALAWLLVMTGINGNFTAVGQQFEQDVMGSGGTGFLNFLVGMIGIAAFFRLIGMPNAGKVFLVLVLLVFVLKNESVLATLENVGSASTSSANSTTSNASGVSVTGGIGAGGTPAANATPLTTPAPGTGSGGIGSA